MTVFEESMAAATKAVARRDWTAALGIWEVVTQQYPDRPEGFVGKGGALIELGRSTEAEQFLAHAMGRFPDNLWSPVAYAQLSERARNWREALRRWEVVRDKFPDAAVGHVGTAAALRMLDRIEDADQLLAEADRRFPTNYWVAVDYARLAALQRRWDEAVRRWDRALQRFPDDATGHVEKTAALIEAGRLGEAEDFLKIVHERFPAEPRLAGFGLEIAAQRRAATRADVGRWHRQIRDELSRLRAIAGEDHALLLRTIYRDVLSLDPAPARVDEQLRQS